MGKKSRLVSVVLVPTMGKQTHTHTYIYYMYNYSLDQTFIFSSGLMPSGKAFMDFFVPQCMFKKKIKTFFFWKDIIPSNINVYVNQEHQGHWLVNLKKKRKKNPNLK